MNLQLAMWLPYWRFWMAYHRYTVEGLEHLDGPQAKLIAGYHGRDLALDMCMLNIAIYDRLHYMPHSLMHRIAGLVPFWRWLLDGLEFFIADGPALAAAVKRGEHLIVTPGGATMIGDYSRHWFSYVVPVPEPGAGNTIFMTLMNENTIHLKREPIAASYEVWVRCSPSISAISSWPSLQG